MRRPISQRSSAPPLRGTSGNIHKYSNICGLVLWVRKSSNDGHIYEGPVGNWRPPVDDVCQQVVVSEPVLCVDLLVVHRQRAVKDAPFLRKRFHIVHMENEHLRIPRQDEP